MILNTQVYRTNAGVYRVQAIYRDRRYWVLCQKRHFRYFWVTTKIEIYYAQKDADLAWHRQNDKYHKIELE